MPRKYKDRTMDAYGPSPSLSYACAVPLPPDESVLMLDEMMQVSVKSRISLRLSPLQTQQLQQGGWIRHKRHRLSAAEVAATHKERMFEARIEALCSELRATLEGSA